MQTSVETATHPALATMAPNLARLQERAFGGEDVASQPDQTDDSWWPKGPLVPGVAEMIEHIVSGISAASGLSIFFLLGGAGNGKSFAARELASRLGVEIQPDEDGLARRAYRHQVGGVRIVLLNDATIAPISQYGTSQSYALGLDVASWIADAKRMPTVVFCCINRGIIIDEVRAISSAGKAELEISWGILEWLAKSNPSRLQLVDGVGLVSVSIDWGVGDALKSQGVIFEGVPVTLHALSVDTSSLTASTSTAQPPAPQLLGQVISRCEIDVGTRPAGCPVAANVRQLSVNSCAQSWARTLRAAEVSSGRLLSYRDLWGAIALSVLGPRVAGDSSVGLRQAQLIDKSLEDYGNSSTPWGRLDALIQISPFRIHNAVFRSPIPHGTEAASRYPPAVPLHAGITQVDPSLWGGRNCTSVESAMQRINVGALPSEQLIKLVPQAAEAFLEFDRLLELALVDYVGSPGCSDSTRRRLISWFSGYLMRLVGLATGEVGNAEAIGLWEHCYKACECAPSPPPEFLKKALKGLLFPAVDSENIHSIAIRALAPRAEPIGEAARGEATEFIAETFDHSAISLRMRRSSGRLTLECVLAGHTSVVGEIAVDLPLIRDALAWRNGRAGHTEGTAFIEPRLERCRAASLSALPDSLRSLVAVIDGQRLELLP